MLRIDDHNACRRGLSLDQIQGLLQAGEGIRFDDKRRKEICEWVQKVLVHHEYQQRGRRVKGILRRYVEKMTGLSRALPQAREGGGDVHGILKRADEDGPTD